MCKKEVALFITFTFFSFAGILTCSILNMIFSTFPLKEKNIFKMINLINYKNKFDVKFLNDIEFGKELENKSDYNSSIEIKNLCYLGKCILESNSIPINNCSKACFEQSKVCFFGEEECLENECQISYRRYYESECHEFNRIKKWRDTEILKDSKIFEFIPYTQIKTKDEICDKGYRKCGKINEEEDFLCLKEDYSDFKCPINKIVILPNNKTPSDNFNYKNYKIGDKNVLITNEHTDDYLISDLFINFGADHDDSNFQLIDKDSYLNFSKYNNISLEWWRKSSSIAKLNAVQYHSDFTVKEMRKNQESFNEKNELYSKEKIEEMNLKANRCNGLLLTFGICELAYFILFVNCMMACCFGDKNRDNKFIPMKYVILFYIVLSPFILLSMISFIITTYKIFVYNKLSSMKYINEFKNFSSKNKSYLGILIYYNKAQFINLLIILLIIIFYPIIIKKTTVKKNLQMEKL